MRLLLCCFIVSVPSGLFAEDARPNAILFIADDVSWNDFGCYGNKAARTPIIDELAANGLRFTNAYLTASSCSPSRSSIVTGRYPHNNGKAAELHLPISANLPWFPGMLKADGYFTVLSGKNHMTVGKTPEGTEPSPFNKAWHHTSGGNKPGNTGGHANWVSEVQNRPRNQPFFFWFASTDAHRGWNADKEWNAESYGPKHRPEDVIVPPFLVDDAKTRSDLASYYNEVTRFDYFIGQVVEELKSQGVLDNTLLMVMADNGRPFPRAKTRLHDSGMKTAFVAHWPAKIKPGVTDSLMSAIDIAPTVLEIAGVKPAKTMQGVGLQPIFQNPKAEPRQYVFSEHNWHDYEAHGRSVRTKDFLLIRNSRPYQAWQGPADSVRSDSHRSLLAAREKKALDAAQADVFLAPRPKLELYRVPSDSHQFTNLAGDPAYQSHQQELRAVLDQWVNETGDSVPTDLSKDSFHRESGDRLKNAKDYRGTTPGEDRNADQIQRSGPR